MLIRSIFLLSCAAVFLTSARSAQAVTPQHFTITYSADITIDPKRLNRGDFSDDTIKALSGAMGNTISVAEVTDTVSFDKDSYRIQSTGVVGRILASFMAKGTFVRTSEGQIVDGILNTLRYVDIRSSNPPLTTLVDLKGSHIFFYSGKSVVSTVVSKARIKDILSFGYSFIGNVPSQAVAVTLSDGKSIKNVIFDVRREPMKIGSAHYQCVKLTRRIGNIDDATAEYWLRESDGVPLRVKIGMSQRYGAVLDLSAVKMPNNVSRY